jgi:phosphatidate phosphatase APP1
MHALLAALLVTPAAWHQLPDGYGTPERVVLQGRVLDGHRPAAPHESTSALNNLATNLATLETDELPYAVVEVELNGARARATADDEGVWKITLQPKRRLKPGAHTATVRLVQPPGPSAQARVHVIPAGAVAVVSDFDDTVVETGVTDASALLKNALLKNERQLTEVPGAAAAYRAAADTGAPFFFLSGSPLGYHERVHRFLAERRFPRGPVFLKNVGESSLTEQGAYKGARLDELFAALPGVRFVLVGDSGERDPEIYRAARARHPERVIAILIRKVPGDASPQDRFAHVEVTRDYADASVLTKLLARGRTSSRPPGR